MTETGLFGGSFNPIHNGHITLARNLLDATGLDEIWFVVSPQNPLKQQAGLLDDAARLDMVRTALAGEPRLKACDYEFRLPKPSYTWNTLQHLSRDYPDRRFTLLIGADNWQMFGRWYHHEDILNHYAIVIYPRSGSHVDTTALPAGVTLVSTPLFDISSTEVRRRIACGEPIDGLVPDVIRDDALKHYAIKRTEKQ